MGGEMEVMVTLVVEHIQYHCNHGGSGTHEDISLYKLENLKLCPGEGGECYYIGNQYYGGGGGGGVLVNGEGPHRSSVYKGVGYGGGGGGGYNGLQGIIL